MFKAALLETLYVFYWLGVVIAYATLLIMVPLSPVIFDWSAWWYVILIPLEMFLFVFAKIWLNKLG